MEEQNEIFYSTVDNSLTQFKSQEIRIIRDLNTEVRNQGDNKIAGVYGLGSRNECVEDWSNGAEQKTK